MRCIGSLLRRLHSDEDEYLRIMLESINNIRDPIEREISIEEELKEREKLEIEIEELERIKKDTEDELRINLMANKEDLVLDPSIKNKYKKKIEEIEKQILEKEQTLIHKQNNDEKQWLRIIVIASDLLQYTKKDWRHPMVQPLFEHTLSPIVCHENPIIRAPGMRTFGLFCQLDPKIARKNINLFMNVSWCFFYFYLCSFFYILYFYFYFFVKFVFKIFFFFFLFVFF